MMGIVSKLGRFIASWYLIVPLLVSLGVVVGVVVFFYAFPGKPSIGVINIPFTVINDRSAFIIGEYLSYAREDDSINAVVINLSSPGGGAAASELLYMRTRRLRDEKPVVLVMNGLVASGGYMMAMGSTYSYSLPSSLVGNVGVVSFAPPLIPSVPDENLVFTGPYKLSGASRRDWMDTMDQLKRSFAQIVVSERSDRLRISEAELTQGRIYSGSEAARLGLVDAVGSDADAIEKAAELAGISNYSLVDVNFAAQRALIERLNQTLAPLGGDLSSNLVSPIDLLSAQQDFRDPDLGQPATDSDAALSRLEAMRGLIFTGPLGGNETEPLPDFPLEIRQPNVYYVYVGHDP